MCCEKSFISIIIPALNSTQLSNTLDALASQTALDKIKEVIVVGQQKLSDYPQLPNFQYFEVSDFPSPARNRNTGAQKASGNWLFFTDSDCLPKSDWVERLVTAITPIDKVLAGAVDIPTGMTYWGKCDHYFGFGTTASGIANSLSIPYAATLNFAIERSLFNEIGGFSEAFKSAGGEDREFCWRIIQKGVGIRFISQAIVIHDHQRRDFDSAFQHIFHYGLVTGQFRLMHRSQISLYKRIEMQMVTIPLLGEIFGLVRIIIRAVIRLFKKEYFKKAIYLPGIMILDLSHTFGMIKALRTYDNK